MIQNLRDAAKAVLRGKFIAYREVYTSLPQETRKISNKKSNLTLKGTRERRTNKPKVSRRKEIIKIRAEIKDRKSVV